MPFFGGLLRFSFDKGATEFAAKLCSSPTNSSLGTSFEYSLIVLLPWDFLNSMFSIVFLRQLKFCQGVSCLGIFFCSKYGHCACAVQHWSTWIRIHHSCATCLAANTWSIWSQGGNILPNLACNKGWSTVAKEKTGFVWFCCRRGRKGKFLCTFHCPLQVSVFPFEASGVSSSSSSSSKEHWICGLGWFIVTVPTHWLHTSVARRKKNNKTTSFRKASYQDSCTRFSRFHRFTLTLLETGEAVPGLA